MPMRSQISGWSIANHYNFHLLYYQSLHRIPPPQPQASMIPLHRHNPLPLRYLMSPLTSPLTLDLPFTRVVRPPIQHALHLIIPAWAQNPSRLQRLVVFNATPQVISMSTAPNTSVPVVDSTLPATLNTAVSEIIAPIVDASPTWPAIVPIDIAPSVTLPITFSLTVLLWRTRVQESSSMMGTLRGSDVVPVVQVFKGGIVTVRGQGLFLSVAHLPPLTVDSPFTFTILIIFFADTFRYIVW